MCFFFSSRRRHTRYWRYWSSDVCSSDLILQLCEQAGVLDGDDRLVGERLQQPDLLVGEGPLLKPVHRQDAERIPLDNEWRDELRPLAEDTGRPPRGRELGLDRPQHVRDVHGPTL